VPRAWKYGSAPTAAARRALPAASVGEPFAKVANAADRAATANAAEPSPTPNVSAMAHAARPTVTRDGPLPLETTTRMVATTTAPAARALRARRTIGGSQPLIAAVAMATAQTSAIVESTIAHECVANVGACALVWVDT
jgi:hypothetical protein